MSEKLFNYLKEHSFKMDVILYSTSDYYRDAPIEIIDELNDLYDDAVKKNKNISLEDTIEITKNKVTILFTRRYGENKTFGYISRKIEM